MRSQRPIPLALIAILLCGLATTAEDQEKKISRSSLPPGVEKTVAAQTGAKIRGFSEEGENGHTFYEAELLVDGHKKDILMDAKGEIVEVEEQVSVNSLATEVRNALRAKAGNGKLLNVESISKNGRLVAYEAQILSKGKRSEVQIGPDGKELDHEE